MLTYNPITLAAICEQRDHIAPLRHQLIFFYLLNQTSIYGEKIKTKFEPQDKGTKLVTRKTSYVYNIPYVCGVRFTRNVRTIYWLKGKNIWQTLETNIVSPPTRDTEITMNGITCQKTCTSIIMNSNNHYWFGENWRLFQISIWRHCI